VLGGGDVVGGEPLNKVSYGVPKMDNIPPFTLITGIAINI